MAEVKLALTSDLNLSVTPVDRVAQMARQMAAFSPDAVVFRLTDDPAPRLLYCFETNDDGKSVIAPSLIKRLEAKSIKSDELIVGVDDLIDDGDVLYGIPVHVCPTVALHQYAHIVRDGRVTERWPVIARDRKLTV